MRRNYEQFAAPLALILVSCTSAADLHTGYSDRPACDYRDGFHVPVPLRKEGAPFEWGVLKLETPVRLRVQEKASTERAQPGDRIDLEVIEDVRVEGFTVIRKGADAWATIEPASKGPSASPEWRLYDPNLPPAQSGYQREFPTQVVENGLLIFQVQGAYDITGGQVALHAQNVIGADDNRRTWEFDTGSVLIWQKSVTRSGKSRIQSCLRLQAIMRC